MFGRPERTCVPEHLYLGKYAIMNGGLCCKPSVALEAIKNLDSSISLIFRKDTEYFGRQIYPFYPTLLALLACVSTEWPNA